MAAVAFAPSLAPFSVMFTERAGKIGFRNCGIEKGALTGAISAGSAAAPTASFCGIGADGLLVAANATLIGRMRINESRRFGRSLEHHLLDPDALRVFTTVSIPRSRTPHHHVRGVPQSWREPRR